MHLSTLSEWLNWISSIHTAEIELGLTRVKNVADRLNLLTFRCPIVTVGGTNGKGSTVAGLEALYLAAGYRVGAFTSPILFEHNEQVRINGNPCPDIFFCRAFTEIANARGDISLTPFEFHTLAALFIFKTQPLDILILEVGLGGRLDAVNILDADVAIVTSIAIDHTDWLGSTREDIAREKAGIFRSAKPAICGDFDPPTSLIQMADRLGAPLFCQGKDFYYQENRSTNTWNFESGEHKYKNLPQNALARQNMSTVLMAASLLQHILPLTLSSIHNGLSGVTLPGRIQVISGPITTIFDVAHNPAAIDFLAHRLEEMPCQGKTHAVFSMLKDKDILTSIKAIMTKVDTWYLAPLATKRATSMAAIKEAFHLAGVKEIILFSSIEDAFRMANSNAQVNDRVLVFGSFHTVAEAWKVTHVR